MQKLLLIGAKGQVGQELLKTLPRVGEVIAVSREELDLTQTEAITGLIETVKPDFLINAAAYTAVDRAEVESDLAHHINTIAPSIMAQATERINATFLHISTDYVFDGTKNTPYQTHDPTNPLSVYGRSKRDGEEAIQATETRYVILRTAWVYGAYGKGNFVKTMLRLGQDREEVRVVSDQIGSPTWACDIAERITEILTHPEDVPTGVYHFTSSGVISWYDLAMNIFEEARKLNIPLKLKQVIPITTAEYPTPAKRPTYSVLSNRALIDCLNTYPPYWRDSLKQMLGQFLGDY